MNLQGRFLRQDMEGAELCELRRELELLAGQHGLEIQGAKATTCSVGPRTRRVLIKYQERNRERLLAMRDASEDAWEENLGIVDAATARGLMQDVARLSQALTVAGLVQTT
jgi:hypothetical protein